MGLSHDPITGLGASWLVLVTSVRSTAVRDPSPPKPNPPAPSSSRLPHTLQPSPSVPASRALSCMCAPPGGGSWWASVCGAPVPLPCWPPGERQQPVSQAATGRPRVDETCKVSGTISAASVCLKVRGVCGAQRAGMKSTSTVQGRVLGSLWGSWKGLAVGVCDGPRHACPPRTRVCEPPSEGRSGRRTRRSDFPDL